METYLTPSNITFALGILGIIFTIYKTVTDPQVKSDKTDALMGQQMQWTAEATERRFKDMQDNFNTLLLQSNNHIHTVDTKVDKLHALVTSMGGDVIRLGTVIEERIPKK